jgi:mannose-6-phosphate isomerase-like protein (cupin superfamily)
MAQYAMARLDEIDELADHGYRYRPIRHHFGIMSFGVTAWTAREAGDAIIGEYDEDSEPSEELFVVVSGCAVFHMGGESVEAPTGALVHARPGMMRTAVATEPRTTILAVAGSPGKAYDATGWELWAPLVPLYDSGQHAELASRLKAVIAANPQYPMLVYNLACCESLSGRTGEAIDHLRQAVEAAEKFRGDARGDADFDPIRDEPAFTALISEVKGA